MKRKSGRHSLPLCSRREFAAAVFLSLPTSIWGKGRKKTTDLYAIIGGTVFRDPGFAMRGVEVQLEPVNPVVAGVKLRPQKTVSDARGEYAFRVPPIEAQYTVKVTAGGMRSESKPAQTHGGEERIDVTFNLLPASK